MPIVDLNDLAFIKAWVWRKPNGWYEDAYQMCEKILKPWNAMPWNTLEPESLEEARYKTHGIKSKMPKNARF